MAIYSLHHSFVSRAQKGLAAAHVRYVTRRRAAAVVLSARMPAAAPGQAAKTRAWLEAAEAGVRNPTQSGH